MTLQNRFLLVSTPQGTQTATAPSPHPWFLNPADCPAGSSHPDPQNPCAAQVNVFVSEVKEQYQSSNGGDCECDTQQPGHSKTPTPGYREDVCKPWMSLG